MAKRWSLLVLLVTMSLLMRQGWIQMDWQSILDDQHIQASSQIQENSKTKSLQKAMPGGLPPNN